MEFDKSKLKAGAIIAAIIGVFVLFLVVLSLQDAEEDKVNFPEYENLKIKENDVKDTSSNEYKQIKERLENDYYFIKEALVPTYNYKFYTSANLEKMVWNYIFSFELSNKKYLSSMDTDGGNFCMRKKYVIESFEELYGVNITADIELLDGYYEYVKSRSNNYCFNFGNVARDYNNEIKILVEAISVDSKIVTANLYLFEYYTTDTPKELENVERLKTAIKNSSTNEAISIVENSLNGKYTHKQLQFVINNGGKFFKYQILNSKKLDY